MSLLSLNKPSPERLQQIVASQAGAALTYDDVGSTRGDLPLGWSVDDQRVVLGHGEESFRRAVSAMCRWTQFDLGWVRPLRADVPIREGELFTFVARTLGVWSVNICRIVYVIDEDDAQGARFGFAYGTVGAHSVRGEESFLVRWDKASDEVAFGIRKFSKPASALLRFLGPITRWVQRRFTREAMHRLAAEVAS